MKILGLSFYFFLCLCSSFAQWVPTNGPAGGDITAFEQAGGYIFAGSKGGGVFKTNNNGATWLDVNNGLQNRAVCSMEVIGDTIFVGTYGGGLYVSYNLGNSWNNISGLPPRITCLLHAFDGYLYAGCETGIIKVSPDSGITWLVSNTIGASIIIRDLEESGPNIITGTNNGIYISSDHGANWISVPGSLTSVYTLTKMGADVYAGGSTGVVRSTDNGISWNGFSSFFNLLWVYEISSNGSKLFVSTTSGLFSFAFPNTSDTINIDNVFLGNSGGVITMKTFGDTLFAGTNHLGVFVSDDEGVTWSAANEGLNSSFVNCIMANGQNVLAGTNLGIYLSPDTGNTWIRIIDSLPAAWVPSIASNSSGIFASFPMYGVYFSSDSGVTWSAVNNGLSTVMSQQVFQIWVDGTEVLAASAGGVFRTSNNGQLWTPSCTGLTNTIVRSIIKSGQNYFVSTDGGVFVSIDNGFTWNDCNNGLPIPVNGLRFATWDTLVYVATPGDGVLVSSDTGNTWIPLGNSASFYDIQCIQAEGPILYIGMRWNGVNYSVDGGNNWIAANFGLTYQNIISFGLSGSILFAGTSGNGVFKEDNFFVGSYEQPGQFLQIYPNPVAAKNLVTIETGSLNFPFTIEVFHSDGKLVSTEFIESISKYHYINTTHLEPGVYFVRITGENSLWSGKLIIE